MSLFGPDTLSDEPVPQVDVFTDGGCDPNPGPGGWGAIIHWGDQEWVLSGNDPDTTNNRMELQAAAAALALLHGLLGPCHVHLYTDSQYLRRGISKWIHYWVSHGWRTKSNQAVKNQDLWRTLYRLTQAHQVEWHWLQGHSGHPLNERADRLATSARETLQRSPQQPPPRPTKGEGRTEVQIYVKASGLPQGPSGWGAVLRQGERTRTLNHSEAGATVNAMLIQGAAESLRALTRPCRVVVYADADYLVRGASTWVKAWQDRGWRTRDGNPVANRAGWEDLLQAARPHQVTWQLVQGDEPPPELVQAGQLAAEATRQNGPTAPSSTEVL